MHANAPMPLTVFSFLFTLGGDAAETVSAGRQQEQACATHCLYSPLYFTAGGGAAEAVGAGRQQEQAQAHLRREPEATDGHE